MAYKICTLGKLNDCPDNSKCTSNENNNTSTCICLQNFIFNSAYNNNATSNNDTIYCLQSATNVAHTNETIYYLQPQPQVEHLAFGIIIVLLIAILATAFLYTLIVLKPIQRTQRAYVKMKLRRANHEKLQEMDEISLSRPETQAQLYI